VASWVERARQRVRDTGARLTGARVRVLAALLEADRALSHAEVQRLLARDDRLEALDRVTVYRVLDWLVEAGLAHRVAGPDRVGRFSAHAGPLGAGHGRHGHFKCVRCDRVFCMNASPGLARSVRAMLPEGFAGDQVELTVLGRCADCAARHPSAGADALP
jgi:Fur family ferric uptake transcriptional regulator